jgi:UDP-N-acetylmuramoyl-tripeptide--D-alanyl-D-alanine ligase
MSSSFTAELSTIAAEIQGISQNIPDPTIAQGITTDSRSIQVSELFVALRGENFDGHDYVAMAIAQGARAAIVDGDFDPGDLPVIVVADTLKAYQTIARWWRRKFSIPVIAITGSVGKTTCKELIAAVLSNYGNVLKTQANFNNEIGVPKTLLELRSDHDFAVVEMGMRGVGQIAELALIAEPTIGLICTVGTAHIELLGSREAIANAKCELFAEMPKDSIAILNADNALLVKTARKVWTGKTLSYGFTNGDVQGTYQSESLAGGVTIGHQTFPLPLPGEHNAINYLGALTVAAALGLDWTPFEQGLLVDLPGGRAKRYELAGDVVLLDETYNAGLESMLAALTLLSQTPGKRRIAVLGTMKELGDYSIEFHELVGDRVQALQFDQLLVLADPLEANALISHARSVPSERFEAHEQVIARLKEILKPGDRVLFKASRSVALDRVVNALRE